MNTDQRNLSVVASADVSTGPTADVALAAYVQSLGEASVLAPQVGESVLASQVDVSADGSDYLDDMVAAADGSAVSVPTGASQVVESADIDDSEFLETKLRGYAEVTDLKLLYPGDHMRITQNKYRQAGRKCSYLVMKRYDAAAGVWWVNGFKSTYPDWQLSVKPLNRYKQIRFYRKIPVAHTGCCNLCSRKVKAPYNLCYDCRNAHRK